MIEEIHEEEEKGDPDAEELERRRLVHEMKRALFKKWIILYATILIVGGIVFALCLFISTHSAVPTISGTHKIHPQNYVLDNYTVFMTVCPHDQ